MARRFTPVYDQEKTKSEQKEEELRKHRQFDTPHSLLAANLDEKPKKGDLNPLGKPNGELCQDGNKLWRKKEEVFGKTWTWGRETFEYSNPEQAKGEAADRPRRAGESAGWSVRGNFGGGTADMGIAAAMQRGEVDQTMVKNEKGLWVRKKEVKDEISIQDGHWQCPKCGTENIEKRYTCKDCGFDRPRPDGLAKEDPRLEAAKTKGRGTRNAAEEALKALEERRKREKDTQFQRGESARKLAETRSSLTGPQANRPAKAKQEQVRAAKRLRKFDRWQGVHRSDEDARRIVGKVEGSSHIGKSSAVSADDEASDSTSSSPSRSRSRSRTSSKKGSQDAQGDLGEECVVDFF
mmetsp:Transcript_2147/g.4450  ORF Transcript_2147/g.4450 Transcript_2147/m.4450 type:complete len:351 (+) Transcript_2147:68-1120(+)